MEFPDVEKLVEQQREYCIKNELPMFIPTNGICWSCRQNIFMSTGLAESADKRLITGCPFCDRSYCD